MKKKSIIFPFILFALTSCALINNSSKSNSENISSSQSQSESISISESSESLSSSSEHISSSSSSEISSESASNSESSSSSSSSIQYQEIIDISTNPSKKSITIGDKIMFYATGEHMTISYDVYWSLSDPTIGTIADNGLFTGVKAGTTTVIATLKTNPLIIGKYDITVEDYYGEYNTYTQVKENYEDLSGYYLLVHGGKIFNGSMTSITKSNNYDDQVDIKDYENNDGCVHGYFEKYEFQIVKAMGGYTIKSFSGLYIGSTSSSNISGNATNQYINEITFDEDGEAAIICNNLYLRYNYNSYSFRYYKNQTTDGDIELFKRTEISTVPPEVNSFELNNSNFYNYGTYNTGNQGKLTALGYYEFGYYRIASYGSDMCKMIDTLLPNDNSMRAAIWNERAIAGIYTITVNYRSESGLKISYGNNKSYGKSQVLATAQDYVEQTVTINERAPYFSIETCGSDVYLRSVKVTCDTSSTDTGNLDCSKTNNDRIEPVVYNGTLEAGVSSVTIPNEIQKTGTTYKVLTTKTYTYYTLEYVYQHQGELDMSKVAMTDPVDVANYYIAFGKVPVNYGRGNKNNINSVYLETVNTLSGMFGSDTRQLSEYTRTNGYATSVPWRNYDTQSTPLYYEFDIDVQTYATNQRGVGRVVMWVAGFTNYGNYPVAVLTDDHYVTFQEYLNYGSWGDRFDAQASSSGSRTNKKWSISTTLTLSN